MPFHEFRKPAGLGVSTSPVDGHSQGFQRDAAGDLVTDAAAPVSGTVHGVPLTASGAVAGSASAPVRYHMGMPLDAAGRLVLAPGAQTHTTHGLGVIGTGQLQSDGTVADGVLSLHELARDLVEQGWDADVDGGLLTVRVPNARHMVPGFTDYVWSAEDLEEGAHLERRPLDPLPRPLVRDIDRLLARQSVECP